MNASELSAALKALLSIRAVLTRAGVNESSFYTASHRGSPVAPETRERIAAGLRATADELRAVAARLDGTGAGRGART